MSVIRYIVNAKTQAEADRFCKIADKLGYKWRDGSSSVGNTGWREYRQTAVYWLDTEYGTNKNLVCLIPLPRYGNMIKRGEAKIVSINEYFIEFMKQNSNFRMFARRFDDNAERIEAIREFVPQTISVGIDYADKDNPVIRLYNEDKDKPFAQGNVGDYVINDNGNFRIVKSGEITAEMLMAQK